MELLDSVAAKFHEEPGVFKLLVSLLLSVCCVHGSVVFLLDNASDSGLHHGSVPSGLLRQGRVGRPSTEAGANARPTAEDIRRYG